MNYSKRQHTFLFPKFFVLFFSIIMITGFSGLLLAQTPAASAQAPADLGRAAIPLDTNKGILKAQIDSGADSIPRIVHFVKANYPSAAIARGIEGSIILDLLVSDSGTVDSVAIVKSVDSALGLSAAVAAKKFRFSPARFQGKAEAVILQYEYRFSLDEAGDTIGRAINFKGTLMEYGTRKKIPNALIRITPLDTGMTMAKLPLRLYLRRLCALQNYTYDTTAIIISADSLGAFSCGALPACQCLVRVIASGYEVFADYVVIKEGKCADAAFYIKPEGFGNENEIVVYGKVQKSQVSHYEMKPSEIRRVAGFSGDAIRVIQAMPGVARSMFGGGELQVRGAGPYDNKFFIDGMEVPYVYHTISTQAITESVYNGYFLSQVDFYPGGFDSRYGGAIGGVVDVKPREIRRDGFHGAVELSMLKSSVALETPVSSKISVGASFRKSYLDLYKPFIELMLPGVTTMPYYQDYLVRADFAPLKNHHFFVSMIGADDGIEFTDKNARGGDTGVDSAVDAFKFKSGFKLYMLGADFKGKNWGNELRLGVRPMNGVVSAFGQFKYTMENGMAFSLRNTITRKFGERLTLYGGVDFIRKSAVGAIQYLDTIAQKYSMSVTALSGGPFFGLDFKTAYKLTLSPSIRADFHYPLDFPGTVVPEFWDYSFNNATRIKVSPAVRLKALYELSMKHKFQAMTGTYSAGPHITDYSMAASMFGDDAAIFEAMNPVSGKKDAQLIHGQQNVVGYTWTPAPLFSAEIQAYLNRQWNVTRYADWQEYEEGPRDNVWVMDNGQARMKGLEVLIRRNQGKRFFGWIAYTLSKCEEYDPWMHVWSKRDWDITNYLQLIGSWKITPAFEFGLRARYSDGFWYTPVTGRKYYDEDWSYYRFNRDAPKSKRMNPYINLDLRFEQKYSLKWANISAFLEGINLVNILEFVKKKNGKPVYRMPEGNWFDYNFYGDEKNFQINIPLGSLGVRVEF